MHRTDEVSPPMSFEDMPESSRNSAESTPRRSLATRALQIVALVLGSHAVSAQTPDWVTQADDQFARAVATQSTGASLVDQSRVAWMLFARVNQPQPYQGNTFTRWELWPSNDDTFSPAVGTFAAANKVRTRPHLQAPKVHALLRSKNLLGTQVPVGGGEEVTRNLVSYNYLVSNKLNRAIPAWKRLSSGPNLNFPIGAIEIKADWFQGQISGAYTNVDVDGTVYSLVGIHIMAKVAPTPSSPFFSEDPSWFWTTFEFKGNQGLANAQSLLTYKDMLPRTEALQILTQAGLASGPFANYLCNGTQIRFSDAKNPKILLGNTTMETFAHSPTNANPAVWKSWNISCHTCHGSSSANGLVSTNSNNNPVGGNLNINPWFLNDIASVVGPIPPSEVNGYKPFDFVWSLWFAK